jgi:hypothetical protein
LALPLLLSEAVHGKSGSEKGLAMSWILGASWTLFLISIVCGLVYQWVAMRRLWDQYHMGHRTIENMHEAGYRVTKGIPQTGGMNLSWFWLGMTGCFFLGAVFFVFYAWGIIHGN